MSAAAHSLDVARDLLQRARVRLVDEPDTKRLDAEIVAFLADKAPTEGPSHEYTHEENFAALKRLAPSLAAVYERAAAKRGIVPWNVSDEQLWEECPSLRLEGSR